jgi:hypothetical protein
VPVEYKRFSKKNISMYLISCREWFSYSLDEFKIWKRLSYLKLYTRTEANTRPADNTNC